MLRRNYWSITGKGTYEHSRWIFRKRGFSLLWDTVTEPSTVWSCFTSIGSGRYRIVCRRWPKIIIILQRARKLNKFFYEGIDHCHKPNLLPMGRLILRGCGQKNCIFRWSSPFILNNFKWIQIGRNIMGGLLGPIELHLKPETKAMNGSFKQEKEGTEIRHLICEFERKITIQTQH